MAEESLIVAVVVNIVAELLVLSLVFVEELLAESLNVKCLYDVIPVYIPVLVNEFLEILSGSAARLSFPQ